MSMLNHNKPAQAAPFQESEQGHTHLIIVFCLLTLQIYAHHDMHYRLPIYELLADGYNQKQLLSWFIIIRSKRVEN